MLLRSMIRATVVVAAVSMPVIASAQVSPIGLSALKMIRFDAPAPSARGLALAGTGIGMPDDATAAMTNPAALRFLVRGEAIGSFGWHQPSFDMISNRSLPPRFSAADLTFEPLSVGSEDLSFGVAYPTRRFAAAGFVRTLSKSLWGTEGTELLNGPLGSFYGKSYWKQFGFATSVSLSDYLALGGAVNVNQAELGGSIYNFSTYVTNRLSKLTYDVGVSSSIGPRVHLGAVHRRGTKHQLLASLGEISPSFPEFRLFSSLELSSWTAELQLPDATGVGVGIRVSETFRVLADVTRTRYSQLTPAFTSLLRVVTTDPGSFEIADSTDLRLAAEYMIPMATRTVALRAGIWRENSHALTYLGPDPIWRAIFPEGPGDRLHWTFGAGVGTPRLEFSAGADVAEGFRMALGSLTIRFQ